MIHLVPFLRVVYDLKSPNCDTTRTKNTTENVMKNLSCIYVRLITLLGAWVLRSVTYNEFGLPIIICSMFWWWAKVGKGTFVLPSPERNVGGQAFPSIPRGVYACGTSCANVLMDGWMEFWNNLTKCLAFTWFYLTGCKIFIYSEQWSACTETLFEQHKVQYEYDLRTWPHEK